MEFKLSTWMMLFFILFMILGIWKIYKFLPNKTLEDDDTTEESHEELIGIIHAVLQESEQTPTHTELFHHVTHHKHFNKKHFWRFNQNKLNQLLNKHFAKYPHLRTMEDFHKEVKEGNKS